METKVRRQGSWGSGKSVKVLGIGALFLAMVITGLGRASGVGAQEATPVATSGAAVVNVVGHGEVTVEPDMASTTIGVMIMRPTLGEAQSEATTTMTAVLDAIKEAGVRERDIQTSYYSVNIVSNYDSSGSPTEVIGYQVTNQANVVIRDLDKVDDVLEGAVGAGANSIYGITFGIADPSAATSEARADAVADAKARAEELADAAGMTLGGVVSISEGIVSSVPYANGQMAGGMGAGGVQFGSLQVTVEVQVTYELS